MTFFQDSLQYYQSPFLSKCNSIMDESNIDKESAFWEQQYQNNFKIQKGQQAWSQGNIHIDEDSSSSLLKDQIKYYGVFIDILESQINFTNESSEKLLPEIPIIDPQVSKVIKKRRAKRIRIQPKKIFQGKNCCKNIILGAIRTLENNQYCDVINSICFDYNIKKQNFIEYYSQSILKLTGFRAVRDELIINEKINSNEYPRKLAFRRFLTWYLKDIATLQILRGKTSTKNKSLYINYKNKVLLKYINCPETWLSDQLPGSPP